LFDYYGLNQLFAVTMCTFKLSNDMPKVHAISPNCQQAYCKNMHQCQSQQKWGKLLRGPNLLTLLVDGTFTAAAGIEVVWWSVGCWKVHSLVLIRPRCRPGGNQSNGLSSLDRRCPLKWKGLSSKKGTLEITKQLFSMPAGCLKPHAAPGTRQQCCFENAIYPKFSSAVQHAYQCMCALVW